jgi:hypothetical protein
MNNKDSPITLSKNKDITPAGDMHLRTANSDSLRYYIYKEEVIEETVIHPSDYQTANDLEEEEKLSKSAGGVGQMSDPAQRPKTLKDMLDAGLITEGDYNSKKAEVLASI